MDWQIFLVGKQIMRQLFATYFLILGQLLLAQTRYDVSSETEFESAHNQASSGDSIVWESGSYSDVFMDITKDGLIVTSGVYGSVIFNGMSKVEIESDDVTLSGFQFIGGDIGTDHVIRIWGSDVLISQINIEDYTSYKYLIIDEDSKRTTVEYSNFENRLNLDDQNILSILVDNEPGYHKVQYCSFKNFEGTGNDLGIEPIRIGVSSQGHLNSRSLVEYCYFTGCDGDGEIISNKAGQNVMRYNTFENNSKAELVLRHGDEAVVYGNFFLNNMGGVRVREGKGHFIYNNYFSGLDRRAIYLQNDPSDPLEDIHIYHNTIVDSQEFILGGDGNDPPTNVFIANNIFSDPQDDLFEDATGSETWIGNLSFGSLGISRPSGLVDNDPKLTENSVGYVQPDDDSPAIDAAIGGYPSIPLFEGMQYDNQLLLDIMKESRPSLETDRDVGAFEFSSSVLVQPHVTEENTGPSYPTNQPSTEIQIIQTTGGQVAVSPTSETYIVGSTISATAAPESGFRFKNWAGDLTGDENPIFFNVAENMLIAAEFVRDVVSVSEEVPLIIYPNPSSDKLVINWPKKEYKKVILEIIDLSGKVAVREEMSLQEFTGQINISELPIGTYFLRSICHLNNGDSIASQQMKFVKN